MSSHLGIQAVRSLITCQNKLKVKEKLIPLPLMSSPVNHLSLKSLLRPRVSVSVLMTNLQPDMALLLAQPIPQSLILSPVCRKEVSKK
ncbi:MAG: hypothetical protein RMX65_007415 [Nostoc sp. DedQUE01]|nr:hypothetical protein [Nostoc sp. DedQUE11]MDZ8072300.1 hypothetical protein [Nostoc sp. DedQUE01]